MTQHAHTRRTDPETSHRAAASLTIHNLNAGQRAVLSVLTRYGPQTDEAIYANLDPASISESGARTRRAELVDAGLVVDTGKRDRTHANRQTIVWGLRTWRAVSVEDRPSASGTNGGTRWACGACGTSPSSPPTVTIDPRFALGKCGTCHKRAMFRAIG